MNIITLIGRTTNQIELKRTQQGKAVVSFSLAVKRPFAKDTTDFFTVCAWDKQAELLSKYVDKGNQVAIRGHLTNRSWQDQQGNKRYATEVVADEVYFVDSKADNQASIPTEPTFQQAPKFEEIDADDTLPF